MITYQGVMSVLLAYASVLLSVLFETHLYITFTVTYLYSGILSEPLGEYVAVFLFLRCPQRCGVLNVANFGDNEKVGFQIISSRVAFEIPPLSAQI